MGAFHMLGDLMHHGSLVQRTADEQNIGCHG